ncbi:MAG TPA: ABC transporter permease, partial [Thermotoga sp.]|nr:ABC transporter permease [Thermotoga sp.]
LAIWQFSNVPEYLLPKPLTIMNAIVEQWNILLDHSIFTLGEALIGLTLGLVFGTLIASLMYFLKPLAGILYPILVLSQAVPIVAVAPLIVIWFGFGYWTKIGIVTFMCFFPIAVNSYEGFRTVDPEAFELFKIMKASKYQIMRFLIFPHTLPHVLSGLKISSAYAVVGAVIAEWLGSEKGLGVYLIRAMNTFRADRLFSSVIIIVFFSLLVFKAVDHISKILTPWLEERRAEV